MDTPAESLQSLLASLRQHASPLAPIPGLFALHRGDVIEIQGPAASGKTHLLYDILLAVLVPDADAEIAVVVYDTDASFDIARFRRLLLARAPRRPSSALDRQESVRRSLARLHLFRPASFAQLAASIAHLPAYHSSHMPNQDIAVLAIDSVSTFYWADRFSAEQLRATVSAALQHTLCAIQRVRRSHGPLTVLTNWALAPSHSGPPYRQHLHPFPPIEDAVADLGAKALADLDHSTSSPFRLAHHIALSSPPPPTPLDNVLLDNGRHGSDVIDNRQVSGTARSSGSRDIARFVLQITDDDILVQPLQSLIPQL